MRKYLKAGLAVSLALVMTISQATTIGFAANGNNGKGNTKQNEIKIQTQVTEQTKAELRERLRVMIAVGGGTWEGLPEGLAKLGYLPYGLAKQYMNGKFPPGLLKRMPKFRYEHQVEDKDLTDLKNLISSAEYRLSDSNKKTYENQVATEEALLAAINAAKAVVQKSAPTELELKNAYDALKAAIALFDGKELVGEAYYNKIKEIKISLEDYRVKYLVTYNKDVPEQLAHLTALDALIATINKYLGVDKGKMTLAAYNKIVEDAKAFEDYLARLKALIKETKEFIYKANNELKIIVGDDPGEYQQEHVNAFIAEIAKAVAVAEANPAKTLAEVKVAFDELNAAFELFKLRKVLGEAELDLFEALYIELEDAYDRLSDGVPKTTLAGIIAEMKPYVDGDKALTQEVFNLYLDKASAYLPDLYDAIIADIQLLIDKADDMIEEFEVAYMDFDIADKSILESLLNAIDVANDAAKDYIDEDSPKYNELNDVYNDLKNEIEAFNNKVSDLTLAKKTALETLVTEYEAFLAGYDSVYKDPYYTPEQLSELAPLIPAIQTETNEADIYLNDTGDKTYLVLKAHILDMTAAMKAFTDKLAEF